MPETKQVINCETGECEDVQLTQEELAQRAADRLAGEALRQQMVVAEQEDTDLRTELEALRTKAKAVRAGTDTFTAAQSQKILAALVLRETR